MSDLARQDSDARRRNIRRRRPLRLSVVVVTGLAVGLAIGFLSFADAIVSAELPENAEADGIVVFTGGSARVDGALALLADGRADRLLISGVNPTVTQAALAERAGEPLRRAFACCVDVDNARDTIENAAEARQWAEERGFTSLIVVTSDYHMPRSMAELRGAMPEIDLIPYPVSNPDLQLADWWQNPRTFGLLAREYGKYLVAETRQLLPLAPSTAAAH
ncbi:YdcF family protein [Bauldia sp.]|uniref:YdcF family protein n=1 Tax=Bauldia sp. TaxID=2575872 RepID=UPI003BA9CBF5